MSTTFIFTFELDLDCVEMNQNARYLGQISFRQVIVRIHRHIHRTVYCTWTTKVFGKKQLLSMSTVLAVYNFVRKGAALAVWLGNNATSCLLDCWATSNCG